MSERYQVTSLDEVGGAAVAGQARWHTIRRTLGVSAFGINAWTATDDDQQIIGEHDEASGEAHEELYIVLNGHARFTLDGEPVEAPQGTVVHVPDPTVKRAATGSRGTTIVVVGAKPGVAFAPSPWERSAEALAFWPTEEWDKAIEVFEQHLSETPDHAGTHYNLGCAHARAGHSEQALASLERAIGLDGRFREFAQTDDDFASIRDDPGFPKPAKTD